MRPVVVAALVLGVSGSALAQPVAPRTPESRYVTACMKEDTERYCRCEFEAVKQKIGDPKDLEFIVQLEEDTAGIPDEETEKIIEKLPADRQEFVQDLHEEIVAVVRSCPDFKEKN